MEHEEADHEDFVELMPDWGVAEERAGEPVLLDVSELQPQDSDHALQELDDAMQEFGYSYDRSRCRSCSASVSQEELVNQAGPYAAGR